MPRDWSDVFLLDRAARRAAGRRGRRAEPEPERRRGMFRRLRENLGKTRAALAAEVQATLFDTLDDETWERLEEALIMADVGARTTAEVVEQLEHEATSGARRGRRGAAGAADRAARRAGAARRRRPHRPAPRADRDHGRRRQRHRQDDDDRQARLAPDAGAGPDASCSAPPTRSAPPPSSSSRSGRGAPAARSSRGPPEGDPGSVAFEAVRRGRERGADVVIVDTAGRLHTQDDLMAELAKVRRVIAKQLDGAPHETLLTVDATTGQNGLRQAKLFSEAVAGRPASC